MSGINAIEKQFTIEVLRNTIQDRTLGSEIFTRQDHATSTLQVQEIAEAINGLLIGIYSEFFFSEDIVARYRNIDFKHELTEFKKVRISISQVRRLIEPGDINRDTGAFGLACLFILKKQKLLRTITETRVILEQVWELQKRKKKGQTFPFNTVIWPLLKRKRVFAGLLAQYVSDIDNRNKERALPLNNLLIYKEDFIGRINELDALKAFVSGEERITQVIGSGGIGKTHLVHQFCYQNSRILKGGVWYVDLLSCCSTEDIIEAIACCFQVNAISNSSGDLWQSLIKDLSAREPFIIVVDSFEQVNSFGCSIISELLLKSPNSRCIVITRTKCQFEKANCLSMGQLHSETEGVELFDSVAKRAVVGFSMSSEMRKHVIDIINMVDGIPLLIKMAAVRLKLISVEELKRRLYKDYSVLNKVDSIGSSSGKSIVDWSIKLLSEESKRVIVQLSVFEGAFTAVDAEAVVCRSSSPDHSILDHLQILIDSSLLVSYVEGAQQEFVFLKLHRIVKESCSQLLTQRYSPIQDDITLSYIKYFAGFSSNIRFKESEGNRHQELLKNHMSNFLRAFNMAVDIERYDLAYKNYKIVYKVIERVGPLRQLDKLARILYAKRSVVKEQTSEEWFNVVRLIAESFRYNGNVKEARKLLEEEALSQDQDEIHDVKAAVSLATICWTSGDTEMAIKLYELAIIKALEEKDNPSLATSNRNLAVMYWFRGEYKRALDLAIEALKIAQELGDRRVLSFVYADIGMIKLELDAPATKNDYLQKAIDIASRINDNVVLCIACMYKGVEAHWQSRNDEAENNFEESMSIGNLINYSFIVSQNAVHYAWYCWEYEKYEDGIELIQSVLDKSSEASSSSHVYLLRLTYSLLLAEVGDSLESDIEFEKALSLEANHDSVIFIIRSYLAKARIYQIQGKRDEGSKMIHKAKDVLRYSDSGLNCLSQRLFEKVEKLSFLKTHVHVASR